jgi:hypothetical protein
MNDGGDSNPNKEEDEGYLAAEAGQNPSSNPYPCGTIRYEEWMRGWQIKIGETRGEKGDGYAAAEAGQSLSQNPHPRGTIRYAEWRREWHVKRAERQRATRLGRDSQHSIAGSERADDGSGCR